jgi:Leucine-rich repeat (LRR) protein
LKLEGFTNLKQLNCAYNQLTSLDLSHNQELEVLDISNNNFSEQSLSFLSYLINLKELYLGNRSSRDDDYEKEKIEERIKRGIYNRFTGSLEKLKNLTKLE